jgi:hypothetical protein
METPDYRGNVIPLHGRRVAVRPRQRWERLCHRGIDGLEFVGRAVTALVVGVAWVSLTAGRWSLAALMALMEPFVRLVLMGAGLGCFAITVLFGFVGHAPHFPKWGMLAFSIGCVLVYWVFLFVMLLVMGGSRGRR